MATRMPITPRAALARMPAATIHAAIEALLAELDRRDGDPDLEENGDLEPSIGDPWDRESDELEDGELCLTDLGEPAAANELCILDTAPLSVTPILRAAA